MLMKRCKVCGKKQSYLRKGLCHKHYYQVRKYGELLDNDATTRLDKHKVVSNENYDEVIVTDNKHNEVKRFKIDKKDTDKVLRIKWNYVFRDNYFVNRKINYRLEYYLLDIDKTKNKIIFINNDKSDFRRSNLKVIALNEYRKIFKHAKNTSGINGVMYNSKDNKWIARIGFAGRRIHLGTFRNKEDAIKARKDAENLYF